MNPNDFEKRLRAYAAAAEVVKKCDRGLLVLPMTAAALLAYDSGALADVYHQNINQSLTGSAKFYLKTQYNATVFLVANSTYYSNTAAFFTQSPNAEFIGTNNAGGDGPHPLPLAFGYTISAGKQFHSPFNTSQQFSNLSARVGSVAFENNNAYLGIKFTGSLGSAHYGWVHLDLVSIRPNVKIIDWAYEKIAGQGIQAGYESSLPVDLAHFSAQEDNGAVLLSWAVESETDNLGYRIERKSGEEDWAVIASFESHDELKGQGNTSSRTEYAFRDEAVLAGETYSYRLSDVDTEGRVTFKDVISITVKEGGDVTDLLPASPNPLNPSTKIQFTLASESQVTLSVVDVMGRTVQTILSNSPQTAGSHSVHWNGNDDQNRPAASGVYLLLMKAGDVRKTQKVMLVK